MPLNEQDKKRCESITLAIVALLLMGFGAKLIAMTPEHSPKYVRPVGITALVLGVLFLLESCCEKSISNLSATLLAKVKQDGSSSALTIENVTIFNSFNSQTAADEEDAALPPFAPILDK